MNITGIKSLDIMIQLSPLLLLPFFSIFTTNVLSTDTSTEYLRPQIHLTPDFGWMNDPNGLFYDRKAKLWHAYYQYSPNSTVWSAPVCWGHSTSNDLLSWDFHGVALEGSKDDGNMFSGSVVIDKNNTSGFFNESIDPEQRIVAVYTKDAPGYQTQEVAYSLDGGYSFVKFDDNPVINVNSSQQRDPKVLWHEESEQWIMVVAKSQEYKIQIYGSPDLKDWDLKSNFSTNGYLGFQYECPGLVKVPIENPLNESTTHKWVLILAINPGSPTGGSINEYFIGDFDGTSFTADDAATRFMDIGKDFYAFQNFENVEPEDGVLGLAWASNWQYANVVPTEPWRSSMSLVRNYTLRYVDVNSETSALSLIQTPVFDTKETRSNDSLKTIQSVDEYKVSDLELNKSSNILTDFITARDYSGVYDFNLNFTLTDLELGYSSKTTTFGIYIHSQSIKGSKETLQIVFNSLSTTWYIDRSTQHPFQRTSPIFTERMSTYVEKLDTIDEGFVFSLYGVVDRNILELYFNDGSIALTNTFFFSEDKVPCSIEVSTDAEESFIKINELVIRELAHK